MANDKEREWFLNTEDLRAYEEEIGHRINNPKFRTTTKNGTVAPLDNAIGYEWANKIKIEPSKWLWFPYVLDENINTFGGEAGTGKTWNLCAIAAAVTTKQPNGMPGIVEKHGNVLYLGGEDGNSETAKRLKECGADLSKVALVEKGFDCMSYELLRYIDEVDPILIIFDPLLSYFPHGMAFNNYTDARQVMDHLRDVARSHGISILCVIHPPKKDDYRLIHRFTGSGAFVDSVRCVTYLGYHPTDAKKRVGIQPKNNAEDTVPYTFSLDHDLGFLWTGDDEAISIKEIQSALRLEMGRASNINLYLKIIVAVMKVNPQGLHATAKDILKEYNKVLECDVDAKPFGHALNNEAFRNKLLREGITLETGSRTDNRQKYRLYYADFKPLV